MTTSNKLNEYEVIYRPLAVMTGMALFLQKTRIAAECM
jgi:hypothetical protein